ncbi:MAG: InlB B-repeat-containing protein, partial [Clostridia bacterium]|nr:InlB B-repeat-containing protein [Clostridia bacterium]
TPREDVTLYAQWSQLYALSFHTNDGKGKMNSLKTNIGVTVRLPACAFTHKYGCSFDCWTTKSDGTGAVYADQAKLVVSGVMTLYAQWKGLSAKVSFSTNGGKGKMEQITVTTPAQIQLPECGFTKKGYIFTGWIDGNKVLHAPGETITVRNNMKLKAQWTKQGIVGSIRIKETARWTISSACPANGSR